MKKILISWEGYREDFVSRVFAGNLKREFLINTKGPTFSLHRDFNYDYSSHILLNTSSDNEDKKYSQLLVNELKKDFPEHEIRPKTMTLTDPLDLKEIFDLSRRLLDNLSEYEIEVFISTGYPNFRLGWLLLQPNYKQNLKLFQIREARYSKTGKPEKVYLNIEELNLNALTLITDKNETLNNAEIFIPHTLSTVYQKARLIADTYNLSCLILGENGTGKENLANFIHTSSGRKDKNIVTVNCSAYTDELLRSELFGYEKGAFTGADKQKTGVFEEADGGTIFLDEIGDITPKMQVTLLRVLQEKKFQRVGGTKDIKVDVRIIAATNKDIEGMCKDGSFRWDLFFRLNVTQLNLPPLRDWAYSEKKELISRLCRQYLKEFRNLTTELDFSPDAMNTIFNYSFPGNIRELINLIVSLYTFTKGRVSLKDLPARMLTRTSAFTLDEVEKNHIIMMLEKNNYNIRATAKIIGIERSTLYSKMKKHQIKNTAFSEK